jgi:ATP-dependent DNA ligase
LPLLERKEILKETVAESKHVCLADFTDKSGEQYYKVVVANGFEGVVAKRKDITYEQGIRSESCLKIKPPARATAFSVTPWSKTAEKGPLAP